MDSEQSAACRAILQRCETVDLIGLSLPDFVFLIQKKYPNAFNSHLNR